MSARPPTRVAVVRVEHRRSDVAGLHRRHDVLHVPRGPGRQEPRVGLEGAALGAHAAQRVRGLEGVLVVVVGESGL